MAKSRKKLRKRSTKSGSGIAGGGMVWARAAGRARAKKIRGRAAAKTGAAKFLELKDFVHVDLDAHVIHLLRKLREPKNSVLLLSRKNVAKPRYFLSSSNALRSYFRRVELNPESFTLDKSASVTDALGPSLQNLLPVNDVSGTLKKF